MRLRFVGISNRSVKKQKTDCFESRHLPEDRQSREANDNKRPGRACEGPLPDWSFGSSSDTQVAFNSRLTDGRSDRPLPHPCPNMADPVILPPCEVAELLVNHLGWMECTDGLD